MPGIGRVMRQCLWLPSAIFGVLDVYVVAVRVVVGWADKGFEVLTCSTAPLMPAAWYLSALPHCPSNSPQSSDSSEVIPLKFEHNHPLSAHHGRLISAQSDHCKGLNES
jgi:hypothetical protein